MNQRLKVPLKPPRSAFVSAEELTPEAGHAEVFADPQRVEWMLTQRRSLQDGGGLSLAQLYPLVESGPLHND